METPPRLLKALWPAPNAPLPSGNTPTISRKRGLVEGEDPAPKERATDADRERQVREEAYRKTFSYLGDIPKDLQELYTYYDESTKRSFTIEDIIRLKAAGPEGEAAAEKLWANRKKVVPGRPEPLIIKPHGVTEEEIRKQLLIHGIPVLVPAEYLRLPPLTTVPTHDGGKEVDWRDYIGLVAPGSDKPVVDEFPSFQEKPQNWVRPVWMPRYTAVAYEGEVLDDLATWASSASLDPIARLNFDNLRRELVQIASTSYSGNGSIAGQLGRLKAVREVASRVREWKSGVGLVKRHVDPPSYESFKEMMDKRFPIKRAGLSLDLVPSELLAKHMEAHPDQPLTSVDGKSSAGQIWRCKPGTSRPRSEGRKRAEVAPWDLVISDKLIRKLEAPVFADEAEVKEKLGWTRLCVQKNKWEVYDKAELETKTRNYYETNSCFMLPLQIMFKATHKDLPRWDNTEGLSVWNIIGWSPYAGGMDRMIRKMGAHRNYVVVYADNAYVTAIDSKTGLRNHLSLDLVKGEGNIQLKEVIYENRRTLEQFDHVSDGWKRYALTLAPMMSREAVALEGPFQIPIDFLISGTIGTAYYNEVKSVRYGEAALAIARERKETDFTCEGGELRGALALAQEASGCLMKIEAQCLHDDFVTPKPGVQIRADILGMDAMHLGHIGVDAFAPVLARNRLLRALIFFKRESKKSYPGEQLNVVKLMRFKAFYMLGGWLIPGLNDYLRMKIERLLDYLHKVPEMLERQIEDETAAVLEGVNFPEGALTPQFKSDLQLMMTRRSVPLPYEAVVFTCGKVAGAQFASWALGEPKIREHAYNFLPLELIPADLRPKSMVSLRESQLVVLPFPSDNLIPETGIRLTEFGGKVEEARVWKPETMRPGPNPLFGQFQSKLIWDDLPDSEQKSMISMVGSVLASLLEEEGGLDPKLFKSSVFFVTPSKSDLELGVPMDMVLSIQLGSVLGVPHQAVAYALQVLGVPKKNFRNRATLEPSIFGYDLLASYALDFYKKNSWAIRNEAPSHQAGRHPKLQQAAGDTGK